VDGSYIGAIVIAELLIVAQGLVGGMMYLGGARAAGSGIHLLYGFTAILSYPALYVYTQGRDTRLEQLLWAVTSLWVWGLQLRAVQVVGG
jgi:hypothetical protein